MTGASYERRVRRTDRAIELYKTVFAKVYGAEYPGRIEMLDTGDVTLTFPKSMIDKVVPIQTFMEMTRRLEQRLPKVNQAA